MKCFIIILLCLIMAFFWGWSTKRVILNKGYYENWFWWGFFFGPIAFVIALIYDSGVESEPNSMLLVKEISKEEHDRELLRNNGWKCKCGIVNASYTGTCACGCKKSELNIKK